MASFRQLKTDFARLDIAMPSEAEPILLDFKDLAYRTNILISYLVVNPVVITLLCATVLLRCSF